MLFVGTVVAMAMVQPWLLAISVIFSLIPIGFSYLLEKENQKRIVATSETNEKLQGKLMQFIHSYEMLKINNVKEEKVVEKINEVGMKNALAKRNQVSFSSLTFSTLDTVSNLGNLILIGLGGYWITNGTITVGELVSCMMLSDYIVGSTNGILQMKVQMKSVKDIKKKIELEMVSEEISKKNAIAEKNMGTYDVFYDNVSFGYNLEEENKSLLIKNRSFLFEQGRNYAVIGESGTGKSTFIKLMMKYNTGYQGNIFYQGKEIREYTDEKLYGDIGYLNQNEAILNETLFDNITLYNGNNIDRAEYEEILKKVNLVELANRVKDENLGDFGEMLSGGERQRIALARVLLRKPKILVLDEPMTGLDVENQKILNDVVFSLEGITKIIITHDRNKEYLKQFDEVLVF